MRMRAPLTASLLAIAGCGGSEQDAVPPETMQRIAAIRAMTRDELATYLLIPYSAYGALAYGIEQSPAVARQLWEEFETAEGEPFRECWLGLIGEQRGHAAALVPRIVELGSTEYADIAAGVLVPILGGADPMELPEPWRDLAHIVAAMIEGGRREGRLPPPELEPVLLEAFRSADVFRRRVAWGIPSYCGGRRASVWRPDWQPILEEALDDDDPVVFERARTIALQHERGARSPLAARWLDDPEASAKFLSWVPIARHWTLPETRLAAIRREIAERRDVLDSALDAVPDAKRPGVFTIYVEIRQWVDVTDAYAQAARDPGLAPFAVLLGAPYGIHAPGLREAALRFAADPEERTTAIAHLVVYAPSDPEVARALASIVVCDDPGARRRVDDVIVGMPETGRAVFDAYAQRIRDGMDVESALGPLLAASFAGATLADVPGLVDLAERVGKGAEDMAVRARGVAVFGRIALERDDLAAIRRALLAYEVGIAQFSWEIRQSAAELAAHVETMVALADRVGGPVLTEPLRRSFVAETHLGPGADQLWDMVELERVQSARVALAAWRRAALGF